MNEYWAYLHTNGTIHTKRYFGELDLMEAGESPFVAEVMPPYKADTIDEAMKKSNNYFSRKLVQ